MDKDNMKSNDNSQLKFINALSRREAIQIILALCKDLDMLERISTMAKSSLSDVVAAEIADEVFECLNSIQVEGLWNNSGQTSWGYQDPTEVAFEMIEDEVQHYIRKMEQYRNLGIKAEEKECCKGIISGLLRYGEAGNNEFRDWCPDDPYTVVENIIYDWKNDHTPEEVEEIQTFYDGFFSDNEEEAAREAAESAKE